MSNQTGALGRGTLDEQTSRVLVKAPIAVTADGDTNGVNREGANTVIFEIPVGEVTGTLPTLAIKVQESLDDAVADPYTDADIDNLEFGSVTVNLVAASANKLAEIVVDARGLKKYLRLDYTVGGSNTPNFLFGVTAVLGACDRQPVGSAL